MESTSTFLVCLLFAAAWFGKVDCKFCREEIRENATVGSIAIQNIAQYCESATATVTEKDDNPYFKIEGSNLLLTLPVRLESNDTSVGKGKCNGNKTITTPQNLTFGCSDSGGGTCVIRISQQDDFPPSFCNQSCYSTERISVNLTETHELGLSAIFYTGKVCDGDACTDDSCITDTLSVNDSYLIGFNSQQLKGTFNLWLNQQLDFEESRVHYVGLTLKSLAHGSINTTLIINVEDIDDHSPAFTQSIYKCTIPEGKLDQHLSSACKVEAYDQDFGVNASLRYEITASFPGNNTFTIDPNGTLKVNGELDRETVSEYALEIMVYEVGRKQDRYNFTTVIIEVKDKDDNPPTFTNKTVSVGIMENLNNGAVIFTPTVTDKDEGENANFTFTINGDRSSLFKIDPVTGAISVKDSKHLDRENFTKPINVTIFVNSTQTPTNSDTMVLKVTLLDVNDNNPVFTNNSVYIIDMLKTTEVGLDIVTVHANDNDFGVNGNVTYSLESNTTVFKLDSNTGSLKLIKNISDSSERSYTLDVKAVDNPTDRYTIRSSWAKVVIHIKDVNIHTPVITIQKNVQNITENGDVGIVIAEIRCTDLDWTDKLIVSIKESTHHGNYLHLSDSLIFGESVHSITLIQQLDKESSFGDQLGVQITCTDGNSTYTENITLPILDQNDNAPVFTKSSYYVNVTINELTLTGTVVFNVSASDRDAKSPNNEIKYFIKSGNLYDHFELNETSGQLTLKESLNASVVERFDLAIVAHDGGNPTLTNITVIQVQILDENDNPPFFLYEPYEATVLENSDNATIKVYAMDPDIYNKLTYTVEDGNPEQCNLTFKNNTLYANHIDAEATTNGTLKCSISVSDGTHTVSTTVTIYVQDVNDNPPEFTSSKKEFNITDTMPLGSNITTVNAMDRDISTQGQDILYLLKEESSFFKLNHENGVLTVQRSLEDISGTNITLTVIAQDAGSPPRQSSTQCSMQIIKENSHTPRFKDSPFRFNFSENQPNISMIILATDVDGDALSYTIVSGNDEHIFSLDNITGVLTTTDTSYTFDYETRSEYELIVKAKDNGTFPRSALATVIISIRDVNEAPTILYGPFERNVTENTYAAIFSLHATDPDRNDKLKYTVGDVGITQCNLTFENNTLYANYIDAEATTNGTLKCSISVSDGTHTVSTTVTIHVQDVNDNPPEFTSSKKEFNITDTMPLGSNITTVNAMDRDISTQGQDILYLLKEESSFFKLNHENGVLTVQRSLEDISGTNITLTVIAQDAGSPPRQSSTQCMIYLTEVNSHSPRFTDSPVRFNFSENQPNFSMIILATDVDGDALSYTIVSGNDEHIFSLDNITGVLTTTDTSYTFDYEKRAEYELIVKAKDNGTFPRSALATVIISIRDVNEAPTILYGPFERNVTENTYAAILPLHATDPDRNDKLKYTVGDVGITQCNLTFENNTLYANYIDAEATTNGTLKCSISVSDGTNTVNTTVTIHVQDVNDNPPEFTSSKKEFNITDTTPEGSNITTINAMDRDISTQGQDILYLLKEESSFFKLNHENGVLTVQRSLEDISGTNITLTVIAQDAGSPPRQSSTQCMIYLTEENSHSPRFTDSPVRFNFSENQPNFSMIILATDVDGDALSYTIVSGNDEHIFSLDNITGVLTTTDTSYTFDYETRSEYELIVNAKDNGTFARSALATVIISIRDVNEAPTILYEPFERNVTENTYVAILPLHATDPDRNDKLKYTVGDVGITQCNLTFENNTLYANYIDAEATTNGTLKCSISVSDGTNTVNTTVTIHVQDVNDNPPEFTSSKKEFNITDTTPEGSNITTINAMDRDISTQGQDILYLLKEESSFFKLNHENGVLTVQRSLEDISGTNITLTVIAQDAGSPPRQSSTQCMIYLTEENSHSPRFTDSPVRFNFSENQPNFSMIILATDVDGDALSYTIVSGNDEHIFSLDNITGVLTTTDTSYTFDYEKRAEYELIVNAKDNGTFPRSALATVIISIRDVNEAPTILYGPFERNVTENTYAAILPLHATDPDRNDKLKYTVGDVGNTQSNLTFENNTLYANYIDAEATTNGTLKCSISVSDGTNTVNTTVTIHVQDVNDNPPEFSSSKTEFNITDTTPDGSAVTTVHATDRDISTRRLPLLYLLEEDSSFFKLHHKTGQLTVQRSLEDISGATINITVIAQDAGSPPLQSKIEMCIQVNKENSYKPEFGDNPISFNFDENQQNFSKFIKATDGDGEEVSYTIVSGNDDNIFSLDNATGLLTTTNPSYTFDYENCSIYTLVVEAKDNGTFSRSATATVNISITDVNEAPTFPPFKPIYRKINTTVNNIIATITVDDPDTNSSFRQHRFSYGSNNCSQNLGNVTRDGYFLIEPNGTIKAHSTLSNNGTFEFTVMVTNLNIMRCVNITVIVSNIEGIIKHYSINENNDVPHILRALNDEFTYKITSENHSNFEIFYNGTSTMLITRTRFDYEAMPGSLDHIVHCQIDGTNKVTQTLGQRIQVSLAVVNTNDNPPVFNSTRFNISLYESVTPGDSIGLVTASDSDGNLTALTYSANETYPIEMLKNGTLRLKQAWDFDNSTDHHYVLHVVCNDTEHVSATLVVITLLDVNDNPPTFDRDEYQFNVTEAAPVGAIVPDMWITGSDVDTMDAGKLTYYILTGVDGHYFTLGEDTGNFTLAEGLDFEAHQHLEFNVMVVDTESHNSTATIKVNVIDYNDNAPRFDESVYNFTVQEGLTYMSDNFTVNATDNDSGMNSQINLRLREPHDGAITLNQTSGEHVGYLHIVSGLDRELPEVPHVNGTAIYTVTVIATDNGNPALTSSALVHIYVEDTNDCPPKFSQSNYNVSVQEGAAIGQQVTSFTTTDCDYNPAFTQTNFTLFGQGHESFEIHTTDGNVAVVTVAKDLDRNSQRIYDLTINVTDGKNTVSTNLAIIVLDTNDHPPRFNRTAYTFSVMEEQKPGVDVGVVSATDEDVGANGKVTYNITSGNQGDAFEIITNETADVGMIRTKLRLDRENQTKYVMIITAVDGATKGRRQGTCTVTVSLLDINDNTPKFNTNQGYKATIIENIPNATVVNVIPRIHADDIDYGSNGTSGIRYSLLGDPKLFHINATTGEVTVAGSIDREVTSFFNLTVVAKDAEGVPGIAHNDTTTLTIFVDDVNDCSPVFVNSTYTFSVVENSNSSTSVGQVSVTDDDVSGTKHVRFRIIHGDDEKFYIDTVNASGIIRVSGNIDRETKGVYTLTVTANDGINEGNTTVTIHVLDTNDNVPVFNPSRMSVMVLENSGPNTSICNVNASDADQGNTNNSRVVYSMDPLTNFSITPTGELFALASLDREQQDRYEITVFAKDLGKPQRTSSMQVVVRVGDVNDNNPEFFDENGQLITEKTVNIVEQSPVNSVVSLIVARDKDAGENGTVMLSIANSNISDYFQIDQIDNVTAVVKVAKSVNINTLIFSRIVSKNFKESVTLPLNITAQDNGTKDTSVMSILTLQVNIEEINDATPVFLHADEPFDVSENADVGTLIGNCQAVVANTSLVHLKYGLLDNNTKQEFSIQSDNCTLRTRTKLDRERLDMYNFPVMVTDGRTPERTAFTVIQIRVLDKNDNRPIFYKPEIRLEILENTNYTQPINVSASDLDIGNNSLITYTLLDTFEETFKLNESTGMLSVEVQLDYELQRQYNITVIATDNGLEPLNATCSVHVTVLDANDNTPQFYNINHTVHVKENFVGKIFTAFANDSDSGMNGKVVYSLNSSLNGFFSIDQLDGAVSLNKPFDYETMESSHIVVVRITATDEGTPPNANSTDVTIEVEDVVDFKPTFDRDIYERNITRSAKIGDPVIVLSVTEDSVKYELQGSDTNYFGLYKGGEINVSTQLDVHRSHYLLVVKATQKGNETNIATCKVIITVVDHLLTFPHKEYNVSLAENVVGNSVLVDLNTTDEISGRHVSYTIVRTEPEANDVFQIDDKGRISCIKELNRENQNMYILYITAEPYNVRRRRDVGVLDDSTSLVRIVVHVMDENDNPPVFPVTQKRQFGVPRDARSGYLVTSLRAVDIDLPTLNEDQINYNLTDGALTMFDIQRDSGDVFVHRALTSTKDNEFNLTVIAFDPKDYTKNDTIIIKIRVIESGDRLLLVTPIPVEDFRRRQDDLIRNMSSVLGIDIQAEKLEAHRERRNGVISVNLDSSDLYFHGINITTGLPVPHADIMARINSQSNQLQALFGRFNVTGVTVTRTHDSSTMGVPEIALLSVAILVFLGGVVAILFACSTLKNIEQVKERKPRDVRMSDLDDFELGTIRSRVSSSRDIVAAAAINPAFTETEFNTSDDHSIPDKPPKEEESQEIRLDFGAEPIDRNLPEADVRGNLVHIPSQSAVDSGVGNTSLGSHDVVNSNTPETDSDRSDLDPPNGLVSDTGPVMTSSPKIVRFKIGEPVDKERPMTSSSKEGDSGNGEACGTRADKPRRKTGLIRLFSNVGETETDDGIETDDNDVDVDVDAGPVKADLKGVGGEIEINTDFAEVTSF